MLSLGECRVGTPAIDAFVAVEDDKARGSHRNGHSMGRDGGYPPDERVRRAIGVAVGQADMGSKPLACSGASRI